MSSLGRAATATVQIPQIRKAAETTMPVMENALPMMRGVFLEIIKEEMDAARAIGDI